MNPDAIVYEIFAKEIIKRCYADEEPDEIYQWMAAEIKRMLGEVDNSAIMTWGESFVLVNDMMAEFEKIANTPIKERKLLTFPWSSWNKLIDPLKKGMLGVVTAPDGFGKTIYAESIAEHWANHKNKIVFVHYELNREIMMMRRTARHTGITTREFETGKLSQEQKDRISKTKEVLLSWEGYITYLHTPGWTMEKTVMELMGLAQRQECDAVVFDYLEKATASKRQLQMYGTNMYQREADNVEQLKTFSESTGIPVLMIAQMNKEGKGQSFDKVDRSDIRGAGEKSDKANLVVLLSRERIKTGYSNEISVLVDKNTMGACGAFKQMMKPEYFRVADIETERKP